MGIPKTTVPKQGDTLAISLMKMNMLLGGIPALSDTAELSARKVVAALGSGATGGGGINYSLSEQDTGRTWINGKKIYQKTVQVPASALTTGAPSVAHNILNVDFFLEAELLCCYHSGGQIAYAFQAPYMDPSALSNCLGFYLTSANIVIMSGTDRTVYDTNYCNLRYTCTNR